MVRVGSRSFGWLAALVLVLTTACGAGPSAADRVPKLATTLERIDAAIVDGDDVSARAHLDELAGQVEQARDSGRLDADEAARILAAADEVRAVLDTEPRPVEPPETDTVPDPELPDESAPDESAPDNDHDKEQSKGKSKGKDKKKKD